MSAIRLTGEYQPEEPPQPRFRIVRDIISVGSILGIGATILESRGVFPSWFLFIAAGFFVVAAIVLAWSLWPSISRIRNTRRITRRQSRIARQSFPEFLRLVSRFNEYMDINRGDKLTYMLRNLNQTQFSGKLGPQVTGDYHLLSGFLEAFNGRVAEFQGSISQFVNLMEEFRRIAQALHELFVLEPYGLLKRVILEEPSVSPQRRAQIFAELEIKREDYVRFMADYQEFAKHVDDQLDTRLSPYLPPIERLSVG